MFDADTYRVTERTLTYRIYVGTSDEPALRAETGGRGFPEPVTFQRPDTGEPVVTVRPEHPESIDDLDPDASHLHLASKVAETTTSYTFVNEATDTRIGAVTPLANLNRRQRWLITNETGEGVAELRQHGRFARLRGIARASDFPLTRLFPGRFTVVIPEEDASIGEVTDGWWIQDTYRVEIDPEVLDPVLLTLSVPVIDDIGRF